MKKLLLYLTRWQLSTPVLAIVTFYLNTYGTIISAITANLIGGLIFFKIDEKIFKTKNDNNKQKGTNKKNW